MTEIKNTAANSNAAENSPAHCNQEHENMTQDDTIVHERFVAKQKFILSLTEYLNINHHASINKQSFDAVNQICGFSKGYWRILFDKGPRQVAVAIEEMQDNSMLQILMAQSKPDKVREKVALALNTRIIFPQYKETQLKLSSFFSSPENLPSGLKAATKTSDIIWRYAGDTSTDYNYYTKRGLLLSVYLKARIFYFADNSEAHFQTREYIKTSLDNVIKIGGIKRNFQKKIGNLSQFIAEKCHLKQPSLLTQIRLPKIEDIPILRFFL